MYLIQDSSWKGKVISKRHKIKSLTNSWLLKLPIVQSFANLAILMELLLIDSKAKQKRISNKDVTIEFNKHPEENPNAGETVKKIAMECEKLNRRKIAVINDLLELKMFEAFLEAAPQAILQVMIVFRKGFNGSFNVVTIALSFASLTLCAIRLFWQYPTQVIQGVKLAFFTFQELITQNLCTLEPKSVKPNGEIIWYQNESSF